jgi:hypothetical protein
VRSLGFGNQRILCDALGLIFLLNLSKFVGEMIWIFHIIGFNFVIASGAFEDEVEKVRNSARFMTFESIQPFSSDFINGLISCEHLSCMYLLEYA